MNIFKIHLKPFVYLTLIFIAMTAIGTVTHELGHYTIAKSIGREVSIHYGSVSLQNDSLYGYFNDTFHKYSYEIKNKIDFPGKEKYFNSIKKFQRENFLITLGGPLQTILTGTIGFFFLLLNRKKYVKVNRITPLGWILIFLSLFWLRQIANICTSVFSYILKGKVPLNGDETKMAIYLKINTWSIEVITGLLAMIVLLIILKIIPKRLLVTFILAGCVGGVLGFYLWLVKFGKYIMP